MERKNEQLLGNRIYASFDGFQIWLRMPQDNGEPDVRVPLDPGVLNDLVHYATRTMYGPPRAPLDS